MKTLFVLCGALLAVAASAQVQFNTFSDLAYNGSLNAPAAGASYTLKDSDTTDSATLAFGSYASNVRAAGSFVSSSDYALSKIDVFIGKDVAGDPSGTLSLKIYSNSATNAPAAVIANGSATETYTAADVVTTGTWLAFTFATPPNLSNGATNWIVIAASTSNAGNYFAWHYHDQPPGRNIFRTSAAENWSSPDGTSDTPNFKAYASP